MGGKALHGRRITLKEGRALSAQLVAELQPLCKRVEVAGSIRRIKAKVGDIEIVAIPDAGMFEWLEANDYRGGDKKRQGLIDGVQVDLFLAEPEHFGAMMLFATGNGTFNVMMRQLARRKGYKLNQYGLWDGETAVTTGETEDAVFAALGINFIKPPFRNDDVSFTPRTRKREQAVEQDDWAEVEIPSKSGNGSYTVRWSAMREKGFCPCKGFHWKRWCSHLDAALKALSA